MQNPLKRVAQKTKPEKKVNIDRKPLDKRLTYCNDFRITWGDVG